MLIQQAVAGLSEAALARFVARARRALRLPGTVSVLVTSSRELKCMNQRFHGKNRPTDVLSFPAIPGLMQGFAGDVAISAEIAARNAHQLGHAEADEIRILTLHGMLHLAGYDHERDHGEMERKERQLRKFLRLPVGLIERSEGLAGKKGLASQSRGRPAKARKRTPLAVAASGKSRSGSRSIRASR